MSIKLHDHEKKSPNSPKSTASHGCFNAAVHSCSFLLLSLGPHCVFFFPSVRFVTLTPGDVFLTGTPPGVGVFRKPPVYLKVISWVNLTKFKTCLHKFLCLFQHQLYFIESVAVHNVNILWYRVKGALWVSFQYISSYTWAGSNQDSWNLVAV